jgi:DNA repair exonuclease SbcCD ATPase subunit
VLEHYQNQTRMQANTLTANSSYDSGIAQGIDALVDTVTDALDSAGADLDTIEAVEEQGEQVAEAADDEIEELQSQIESNEEQIESNEEQIEQEKDRRSSEIEGAHSRISRLKDDIEHTTPTPDTGETTIQQHDLTPIEQLSQADDVSDVTDSPSVERAVSLFKNIDQWGSKTPKGIVLKPADNPRSLLEADRDESLAWKQYYRAAEALEQLSEGSVTFFDSDRHGKMIVLHEQSEAYQRIVDGSLTASSEEATT